MEVMKLHLKMLDTNVLIDLMLYTFLIMFLIGETWKIKRLRVELRSARDKNEELTIQYDEVREVKHNFSNFIQALYGYVEVKNISGIEEMCKRAQVETVNLNIQKDLNINRIANPAIENLILNKLMIAKEKGITLKIDCKTNLRNLSTSIYDVSKIIGILLDNAVEAAADTEDKIVEIKMFESKSTRKKIIRIENSYKGTIDVDKIYMKNYTSKTYEKGSHGLGLWSVKKVVEANDKINLITKVNDKFCQQVEINF